MSVSTERILLVHLIPPPEPLRVAMDDGRMADLVASIKQLGLLLPLLVVPSGEMYEIVDGHRRYMALQSAGIEAADCRIFTDLAEAKFAAMLHANVMREDVTPFEEGYQFLELATKYTWSMDQLMGFFRVSEDYINDRVDIVRKDAGVAAAARDRRITLGQAKEVLKEQDPVWRAMLLEQAAVHGATIGALREMRHQHARELAEAQGTLPMNTPAYAAPEPIISPEACLFCGRNDDVPNLVILRIHQHELLDLKAVLDKFSRRALLEQLKAAP